ncbi:MAG TPA: hypothetical protein VMB79_06010 [Jatrophihabitans sp.]|nr:hypothetical protein [Jatrophihabitans sp.]
MRSLRAATGVLGSGLVVVPALLHGRGTATGLGVAGMAAVAMVAAAALFASRPFGGLGRTVRELPDAARALYSLGFLGGTTYFVTAAAAVGHSVWRVPVPAATATVLLAVTVLGRLLLRRPLGPVAVAVRCGLAVLAAVSLPLTTGPAAALAAGRLPVLVPGLAALLLCVGWESLPALGLGRRAAWSAGLGCALVAVAACWWASARTSTGSPGLDAPVGALVAVLLVLFAAGNTAALPGFWVGGRRREPGQLVVVGVVALGCLALAGHARAWALLLPGLATLTLYAAFAVRALLARPARPSLRPRPWPTQG